VAELRVEMFRGQSTSRSTGGQDRSGRGESRSGGLQDISGGVQG
jgi:hypothetical protein